MWNEPKCHLPQLESFEMNICVLLIFLFLIHYCCRYYTNDTPGNKETAFPHNSNEVVRSGKCRELTSAAYEHIPDLKN